MAKGKTKKSRWHRVRKWWRKRTRPLRHWGVYALARAAFWALNLLPVDTAAQVGELLGGAAYWVMPRLRGLALRNLELVGGARLTPRRRRKIARACFRNAGRGLAEMMTAHRWGRDGVLRRIQFKGPKTLADYQKEYGSVMVVGAHYGAWEFGCLYAYTAWGVPSVAVVRELNNPWLERWIRRWRAQFGMTVLHRGQAGLGLFRQVRQGRVLAMLVDQFIEGPGVQLPFLGRPAHTYLGPALIAQRFKGRILTGFVYRRADKSLVFEVNDLTMPENCGDGEPGAIAIAAAMNDAISRIIERDPTQWMWFHDRWRPPKKKHRRAATPPASPDPALNVNN
ncbi:MAG: lipid A biosynthesis lauroyl acyltransferase [Candidatus Sumerlaeia bacterium]